MIKLAIIDNTINVQSVDMSFRSISHADKIKELILFEIDVQEIEIINLSVLNQSGEGDFNDLLWALEWCSNNGVDIINISLGSINTNLITELIDVCYNCYQQGQIIVAANHNQSLLSYPAVLPFVIGVESYDKKKYDQLSGIDVILSQQAIYLIKGEWLDLSENSFATAYITAKVVNLIAEDCSLNFHQVIHAITGSKQRVYKYFKRYFSQKQRLMIDFYSPTTVLNDYQYCQDKPLVIVDCQQMLSDREHNLIENIIRINFYQIMYVSDCKKFIHDKVHNIGIPVSYEELNIYANFVGVDFVVYFRTIKESDIVGLSMPALMIDIEDIDLSYMGTLKLLHQIEAYYT